MTPQCSLLIAFVQFSALDLRRWSLLFLFIINDQTDNTPPPPRKTSVMPANTVENCYEFSEWGFNGNFGKEAKRLVKVLCLQLKY